MPTVKRLNNRPKKTLPPATKRLQIPRVDELNVPSTEFLDYYTLIYGTSGLGKSSLIASIPESLTCSFEPKRRHLEIRMMEFVPRTVAELEQGADNPWKDFLEIVDQAKDAKDVSCLNIDNIAECYRCCEVDFLLTEGLECIPKDDFGVIRGQVNRNFESIFNALKSDSNMGAIFTAHAKEKDIELNTGTTECVYAPDAPNAVINYLKKAMDFAFYLGWHNNQRAVHVRWDSIWTKCGRGFMTPKDRPIKAFALPEYSSSERNQGYETVLSAFNNQEYDCTLPLDEQTGVQKTKKKIKRSV